MSDRTPLPSPIGVRRLETVEELSALPDGTVDQMKHLRDYFANHPRGPVKAGRVMDLDQDPAARDADSPSRRVDAEDLRTLRD